MTKYQILILINLILIFITVMGITYSNNLKHYVVGFIIACFINMLIIVFIDDTTKYWIKQCLYIR